MFIFILIYFSIISNLLTANAILFSVPESVPIGHVIGYIEGSPKIATDPRYFVVYSDEITEQIIRVDERSGEIVTLKPLDFEKKTNFEVLAIPVQGGEGIQISIEVDDENDHVPTFADERITIEISEFARIGSEFPLPLADDKDGPSYNVQKYQIAQGNVNNVFKVSSRRLNGILYADLVVNGQLDREYRDKYELIIEAVDGGKPPKIGRLRLTIKILDANDNAPIFEKPRYSTSISSTTTIGANILTVKATDADINENSRITYKLRMTRSSSSTFFSLSPKGILTTTAHLVPGSTHDLVIVASDNGKPSLETTAFVTINVQGATPDAPALDIVWLTESTTAHLAENATLGSIVARISIHDNHKNSNIVLSGCHSLCMQQSDSQHIYLLLVCGLFDRETTSEYHLKFTMRNSDSDLILEHPVLLTIGDVNDNAPQWSQLNMHLALKRNGENTIHLVAVDPDQGTNGRIRYSILDTDLLKIDPDSGRLIIERELDCSIGNILKFRVRAEDGGLPPRHSDMMVIADLLDSSGKAPQFEKSLYEIFVKEDTEKGSCLLKVAANNSLCGGSPRVHYAIQESSRKTNQLFSIDSTSGTICLEKMLDYEMSETHQLIITATDQNGQYGTCLVSIRVVDVNDNAPVFNPTEYNISIREGEVPSEALLTVAATDHDEGLFGEISYSLASDELPFKMNKKTGELFASNQLQKGKYEITVLAVDGNGAISEHPAVIHLNVIARDALSPTFTQSRYVIQTSEDILPGISIGSVQAIGKGRIRYSISSGNIDNQFIINPENGRITVARYLDADKSDTVLLNIQADLIDGGTNHTQVVIEIDDHNDNPPVFALDSVDVTIKEDQKIHEPFYVVHATDKDRKKNGEIKYSIISSHPSCPVMIQPNTGQLSLTASIDYERIKFYRIRVKASDMGIPPKSANMTVLLHVSDINDNSPVFEKEIYEGEISENTPPIVELMKITATDKDADENGVISYRITNGSDNFGIDEKTGVLFAKRELDREKRNKYDITVSAEDKGHPPLSATTTIQIRVLDVNDNAPSCSSLHTLVVPADADTKTSFGSIVILDSDLGENGTVSYRSQQTHQLFIVNSNGDVRLRRKLTDSDSMDFRLSVIASDNGNPKKSSVCHVPIKVTRSQTSIQIVEPIERTIRVPKNCSNPCQLIKIQATGVFNWLLQSSDVSNYFSIKNGILSLISLPITLPPWSLAVVLSDKEGRQKFVTLKVLPPFSKNLRETVTLPHTLPIGSKIAMIGDGTENNHYYYTMSNKTNLFELDEVTGTVYLSGKLKNNIGESVHNIYFQKNHIESDSSEDIQIEFQIVGSSEYMPKFDKDIVNIDIEENTVPDTVVYSSSAIIPKEGNLSIIYKLIDTSDVFSIDQYTGDITLLSVLDWYEKSWYSLVVEALCGSVKATQLLNLKVIDVNNNKPHIISDEIVYLWPDSSREVHHVVAVDKDNGLNSQLKYEITTNTKNLFTIDSKSGAVYMEQFPEGDHSITVLVSDYGSPALSSEQVITFKTMNSSNRWHFFDRPEYVFNITDNLNLGATIGKITGKSSSLIKTVSMPSQFVLSGEDLKLKSTITEGTYKFSVLVSSSKQDVDWASVSVTVKSVSHQPRISSTSCGVVTISENKAVKGFKRIIGQHIERFSLQVPNSLFDIDSSTGELSCVELDREKKSEHFLIVVAEGFGKNDTCSVRVIVSDLNDNAPQFSASTSQLIILDDNIKNGDVILQLTADDLDKGDENELVFILLEDPSHLLDMEPKTGRMILRGNQEYEEEEWMIRVRVSDRGNPPLSSDRFIRVRDNRNEKQKKPKDQTEASFLRAAYVADIDEGLERGQRIIQFSTNQRDSRITFSIVEGNIDGAFDIDSDGYLNTAQELDHEIRSNYMLKVIGTGPFSGEMATSVDIKVNNVNDNPPAFPRISHRKVLESIPPGSFISTVTANDIDQNSLIEYSFETEDDRFVIDRYTGAIHTVDVLDYEENPEIELKVVAFDGKFKASGIVRLSLIDTNDNSPIFDKAYYDINVHAEAQSEEIILKVQATDKDSGENGRISYSLEQHEEQFSITSEGSIILHSSINMGSEYLITVIATDHGNPRLTSSVPIRITSTYKEQRKEKPQFLKKEYEFTVQEDLPLHTIFGNLSATSDNLFYRILDGQLANQIEINRLGQLSLKTTLDREAHELLIFEVDVGTDGSMFTHNSTTTVRIHITDVNDNPPVFPSEKIAVTLRNGLANGDLIYRLSASDDDLGDNGRVTYRILCGNDYNIVSLEPETGAVLFNSWSDDLLNKYRNGSWTIVVEARDHGYPMKSSLVNLEMSISLSSWSSTAPFFVQAKYVTHVPETMSINSSIFTATVVNRAGTPIVGLRYNLKDPNKMFALDADNGLLRLRSQLDYETKAFYQLTIIASDINARSAVVVLEIRILPIDEYPPIFTNKKYTFQIPIESSAGTFIGSVRAVDSDGGNHGKVRYSIEGKYTMVSVDPESGKLILAENVNNMKNLTIEQFVVTASSSSLQISKATVYLEIGPFSSVSGNSLLNLTTIKLAGLGTIIVFLSFLIMILCCVCCRRPAVKQIDNPRKQVYSVSKGQIAALASDVRHMSPNFPNQLSNVVNQAQINSLTSSISTTSGLRSALSHRDFASNRSQPDSGIDPDNLSMTSSVTDYLASLGVPSSVHVKSRAKRRDTVDSNLNDLIYARVEDVVGTGPIDLKTRVEPYETTSLRNSVLAPRTPSFQIMENMFDEALRHQDSQRSGGHREYVQIEI